mgnify:CR=1 FL=1
MITCSDYYATLISFANSFKSSFKISFGTHLTVAVKDPEDVKIILNSEACYDKHPLYWKFHKGGIPITGGEKNKLHRKVATPVFHPSRLENYQKSFNTCANNFLQSFDKDLPSKEFNILPKIFDFTLDVTLQTTIGEKNISQKDRIKIISNTAG